jgi:hypothetical protein
MGRFRGMTVGWPIGSLLCLFACLVRGWKLVDVGPPKDGWLVGCLPIEGIGKVQHKGRRPGETCLWSFLFSYFHAHTYLGFIVSTH